jgi:hypothetical protein
MIKGMSLIAANMRGGKSCRQSQLDETNATDADADAETDNTGKQMAPISDFNMESERMIALHSILISIAIAVDSTVSVDCRSEM